MATSSTVSVKITGDASGFTNATKSADTSLQNMSKQSSKTNSDLAGNLKESGKTFRGVGELAKGLGDAFGFPLGGIVDLAGTMKDLSKGAAETLAPAIDKLSGMFGKQAVASEEASAATAEATGAQEGLDAAEDASPIGAIIEGLTLLALAFVYLWQNCTTFRNIVKEAFAVVESVVTDTFGAVTAAVGGWWDSLKAVAKWLTGTFTSTVDGIEKVFSGLGDGITSGFKAVVNNGIIGPINDAINIYDSVVADHTLSPFPHIGDIPQLASGGFMSAAGVALVGEQGPELVHLPGGAQVTPAAQSASMMGGTQTVVIPIQIGSEVVRTVRVELNKLGAARTAGRLRG